MWNTEGGERTLEGAERDLFVSGALSLIDELRDANEDDGFEVGIAGFDSIPFNQKVWAVLWVVDHLLGEEDCPDLAAWNEGTVTAVFATIETNLEMEIDQAPDVKHAGQRTFWRGLIHRTWMETVYQDLETTSPAGRGEKQDLESTDLEEWGRKLELVRMEILHDDDASFDGFMDMRPDQAEAAKAEMGIADDYYTDVPPVLTYPEKRRVARLYRALRREEDERYRQARG